MTKFNYETHGDIPIVDQEYIQTVASVSDIQKWANDSNNHDIENNKRKTISEDNDISIHNVNKLWEGHDNTNSPQTKNIYKQKIAQYRRQFDD